MTQSAWLSGQGLFWLMAALSAGAIRWILPNLIKPSPPKSIRHPMFMGYLAYPWDGWSIGIALICRSKIRLGSLAGRPEHDACQRKILRQESVQFSFPRQADL